MILILVGGLAELSASFKMEAYIVDNYICVTS